MDKWKKIDEKNHILFQTFARFCKEFRIPILKDSKIRFSQKPQLRYYNWVWETLYRHNEILQTEKFSLDVRRFLDAVWLQKIVLSPTSKLDQIDKIGVEEFLEIDLCFLKKRKIDFNLKKHSLSECVEYFNKEIKR